MKSKLNRKGALQFDQTGALLILLVFVVVVIVGIAFGSEYFSDVGENLPGKVNFVTNACSASTNTGFEAAYCTQLRSLDSEDRKWVTCDYALANRDIYFDTIEFEPPDCTSFRTGGYLLKAVTDAKLSNAATANGIPVNIIRGGDTTRTSLYDAVALAKSNLNSATDANREVRQKALDDAEAALKAHEDSLKSG